MSKHKWTENDIPDQTGKLAIVTGANSGIGYETARALAQKGATVILACRNLKKGSTAVSKIRQETPSVNLDLIQLDLADLNSVSQFVQEFKERYKHLDLLINNAGVMDPPFAKTKDGFELQFGTNHLGHFALTGQLLDLIINTPNARVVNVSSLEHKRGKIDFNNLNAEKRYNGLKAYAQSKLANLLFTYELQRRFQAANVKAVATASHPGWTNTNLFSPRSPLYALRDIAQGPKMGALPTAQEPKMGALPTLYAAIAPNVEGGDYYGPAQKMSGYPIRVSSSSRSHDTAVAAHLWDVSKKLTGVTFGELTK
jgi:NAD(P)-dependent dehydrogenase (short-subunit alcohol dehydrogenase family)